MILSATAAESLDEIMWMLFTELSKARESAENGRILHAFSCLRLTGCRDEDCYTFEELASIPDEIRSTYYYHYKRIRLG